jgi:hypothetical protein
MAKSETRKSTSRRTNNVVQMPVVESPVVTASQPPAFTERDIARRAFEIHRERGSRHGHDLDDWFQAERELRSSVRIAVA